MGNLEDRISELEKEISMVREIVHKKTERLNKAEDALRYYANPTSFGVLPQGLEKASYQVLLKDDNTVIKNQPLTYVGGRRARDYFETFGEETFKP